jgi:hypothetical protein
MLRPDVRDLGVGMATGIPVGRRGRGTTVSLIVGRR